MDIHYTPERYSALQEKFGTDENFFNCTINNFDSRMDSRLLSICKSFTRHGVYTMSSSYGKREKDSLCIMFASFVKEENVRKHLEWLKADMSRIRITKKLRKIINQGVVVEYYHYVELIVFNDYKEEFIKLH